MKIAAKEGRTQPIISFSLNHRSIMRNVLLERMQKPYPSLLSDEDVIRPIFRSELKKGADDLMQNGVSVESIKKVFTSVCDMIVKKIRESAVKMEDSKMKGALSTFYATQLQRKLFPSEPSRKHMAKIMVGAVHAAGYDHEYLGPFYKVLSEYEDGYDSIGIIKVSGGCVNDCFFKEGIAFKPRVDGFNVRKVVNPKILLLNIKPVQNIDERVDLNIEDILNKTQKNHVKDCSMVVLSCQAFDEDAKKVLASRHIYFADLVSEDDLHRIEGATCACIISSSSDCRLRICLGTCKRFQLKKCGSELFGIFTECSVGNAATIVLRGDDQFIEEADLYIQDLIPEIRMHLKNHTLVAGGHAKYERIIQYAGEEANHHGVEDSKRIVEVFTKAIQAISDKTRDNVGCNAVARGERAIVWEPPFFKIATIRLATAEVCDHLKSPE